MRKSRDEIETDRDLQKQDQLTKIDQSRYNAKYRDIMTMELPKCPCEAREKTKQNMAVSFRCGRKKEQISIG